jgi:DNA-binding MarR family transcriptional regulator
MQYEDAKNTWIKYLRTGDIINNIIQKLMKKYNISYEKFRILYWLLTLKQAPTPAELTRCLVRDASSITILLKKMEAEGLITREKDDNRKNQVRIFLTDTGRKLECEIEARLTTEPQIFSILSDVQGQQLNTYLDILLAQATAELKKLELKA